MLDYHIYYLSMNNPSIADRIAKDLSLNKADVQRVISFRWKYLKKLMMEWNNYETIIENVFKIRRYESTYFRKWADKVARRNPDNTRICKLVEQAQGQGEE